MNITIPIFNTLLHDFNIREMADLTALDKRVELWYNAKERVKSRR
jgi:hypothetical protein